MLAFKGYHLPQDKPEKAMLEGVHIIGVNVVDICIVD
jgi:hypothetical protein